MARVALANDDGSLRGWTAEWVRGLLPPARSSITRVACVGDSLTAGYSSGANWVDTDAYPAKLDAVLPGTVETFNRGFPGATTDQINTRMGALRLDFTVVGGSVPASGSVNLTTTQVIGGWDSTTTHAVYGWLAGVYGILQHTPAGGYTFTRGSGGDAVAVTRATFEGEFREHATDTIIYMAGRNDITKATKGMETTVVDHAVRGYVDLANYLTPRRKQFVFGGTITRTDEDPGSTGFEQVEELNTRIRTLYPANYVSVQAYLTGSDVWTHTGITPTQADLDAQAQGMTPPSLFDDVTHYNRATAQAIAEHVYAPFLIQKGWV